MNPFIKVFGLSIGLLFIAFGIAAMSFGMDSVGPCGAMCSLNESLVRLIGQRAYSYVYGFSWVLAGSVLVIFILRSRKKNQKNKERK